jgi:hypothetical protein
MSNIGPVAEIRVKSAVIENCWQYVFENFHKFNENNKIKVALAIIAKDLPTKVEGDLKGSTQLVIIRSKEEVTNASDIRIHKELASEETT